MVKKILEAVTISDSPSCEEVTYLAVVTFVSIYAIRKLVSKIFTPPATDTPEPVTDPIEPVDDETAIRLIIEKIGPFLEKHWPEIEQNWRDSNPDDSDDNEPEITPVKSDIG